ncbi:MAG: AbrB/MazE/SpoVT family DNA-binding domain-containing protein, partial [bacterium]
MPTEKLAGRTQKEVEKARDELKDWRKKLDELEEKIKKITKEGVGKACSETKEIAQLVQVREKAQITIPSKIRKALNIKEGDYLEAEVEDNK